MASFFAQLDGFLLCPSANSALTGGGVATQLVLDTADSTFPNHTIVSGGVTISQSGIYFISAGLGTNSLLVSNAARVGVSIGAPDNSDMASCTNLVVATETPLGNGSASSVCTIAYIPSGTNLRLIYSISSASGNNYRWTGTQSPVTFLQGFMICGQPSPLPANVLRYSQFRDAFRLYSTADASLVGSNTLSVYNFSGADADFPFGVTSGGFAVTLTGWYYIMVSFSFGNDTSSASVGVSVGSPDNANMSLATNLLLGGALGATNADGGVLTINGIVKLTSGQQINVYYQTGAAAPTTYRWTGTVSPVVQFAAISLVNTPTPLPANVASFLDYSGAFRIYQASGAALTTGNVTTQLAFDTADATLPQSNLSSGGQLVSIAGWYFVSFSVGLSGSTTGRVALVDGAPDNADIANATNVYFAAERSDSGGCSLARTAVIHIAASTNLRVYYQLQGVSPTSVVWGSVPSVLTYLSGVLITQT